MDQIVEQTARSEASESIIRDHGCLIYDKNCIFVEIIGGDEVARLVREGLLPVDLLVNGEGFLVGVTCKDFCRTTCRRKEKAFLLELLECFQSADQRGLSRTRIAGDEQQLVRFVRKDKIGQDLHGRRLFFGRVMGEILADFEEYIIIYHFLRNNFGDKGSVLNILF